MKEQRPPHDGLTQRVPHRTLWFLLAAVGCVFLVLVAYSNFFNQSLQFEDRQAIERNLYIHGLESIPQLFSDPREVLSLSAHVPYRPLLSLSFAFDYWMAGGLDPWQFHITQFILVAFLGMGFSVFGLFILDRAAAHWSNKYIALVAGLLCCVHIANAEMVYDMSSRASLLGALGVVGSFLMYGCLPTWRPSHLYLLPMMLGALAHPLGVLFAPLLLVYGLLFEKRLSCRELCSAKVWPKVRHAVGKVLPTCLTAMALLLFLDSVTSLRASGGDTFAGALFQQPGLWLHYVERFFLPFGIHEDLAWLVPFSGFDLQVLAGVLCMALLGRMAWVCSLTKEWRPVTFGIIWFIFGMVGTVSAGDSETWANQSQGLFPFMGLMLAVMSSVANVLQTGCAGFPRRKLLTIPLVCVSGAFVVAVHTVGTYQLHDSSLQNLAPTEISGLDRSPSQRL